MQTNVAADNLTRWRNDCGLFAREVLNMDPDAWQDDVFDAVSGKTTTKVRIALKACKGPGKTACLAVIGLWFLSMFPHCKVVCTSITGDNLRDNLWAEFRKWMRRSDWIQREFTWTKERIVNNRFPEEWWISARKWAKDADPEQQANTLAGIHADYVLFILDEAGGIPDSVAAAAEGGLATGKVCKLVIGGNPTHLSGPLYQACTSGNKLWWVKEITGDPEDPLRAPRVSLEWAKEQIRLYGRRSPYVMVNVLGIFPRTSTDSLISMEHFENAFARFGLFDERPGPIVLGADIARYGSDLSVVCIRNGSRTDGFEDWQGMDTQYSASRIANIYHRVGASEVRIDDIGVGGGVTDRLEVLEIPVVPIDVGKTAVDDPDIHQNLRSELFGFLQKYYAEGWMQLESSIRTDTTLVQEGTSLKVGFTPRGKRKIQSKDEYKKITGMSPNFLDSQMLAYSDLVSSLSIGYSTGEQKRSPGGLSMGASPESIVAGIRAKRNGVRIMDRRRQ